MLNFFRQNDFWTTQKQVKFFYILLKSKQNSINIIIISRTFSKFLLKMSNIPFFSYVDQCSRNRLLLSILSHESVYLTKLAIMNTRVRSQVLSNNKEEVTESTTLIAISTRTLVGRFYWKLTLTMKWYSTYPVSSSVQSGCLQLRETSWFDMRFWCFPYCGLNGVKRCIYGYQIMLCLVKIAIYVS